MGQQLGLTGTCHIMIQLATPASHTKDDTPTMITHKHNTMHKSKIMQNTKRIPSFQIFFVLDWDIVKRLGLGTGIGMGMVNGKW